MRPKPETPKPGQESVWDYPRPARAERTPKRIEIWFGGAKIVDTTEAFRVLETSHPPGYYVPPRDVAMAHLEPVARRSFCEWKGQARYFDVVASGKRARAAAWSYPEPSADFAAMTDHIAFYPALMDECRVDGERVRPQPGGFYGGWITSDLAGPFKGEPGTEFW